MPVTYSSRGGSGSDRLVRVLLDWVGKVMVLSAIATVVLYAYLLWGVLAGPWGGSGAAAHADAQHLHQLVMTAVYWLNIALGVFVISLSITQLDEEVLGYVLVAAAIFLYYGVPFLLSAFLPGQLTAWQQSHNLAATELMAQLKTAALVLAVPGALLALRDLFLRVTDSSARRKEEYGRMQYGGSVKEEAAVGGPLIGAFAKCWQLPYCRDAIRKNCPIFIHRTRCWKQRVGCMCEETVVRHAVDTLINKEMVTIDKPKAEPMVEGLVMDGEAKASDVATQEVTKELPPPKSPSQVKIPYNTHLSAWAKAQRCRECVVYNEHQRMKYQFLAPFVVIGVPAMAVWQATTVSAWLGKALETVDRVMKTISFSGAPGTSVEGAITSTGVVAQYVVLGCLVVIATTATLRALEYVVFKLKL